MWIVQPQQFAGHRKGQHRAGLRCVLRHRMRYRFAGKRNLHHAARHLTERNADFLPAEGRVQGIAIRTAYCQHAGYG